MTDEIFVFVSNLAGRHGSGAAWDAWKYCGAIYGVGEGHQGDSYAIPTKDENIKTLPLAAIKHYVNNFKLFAAHHPEMTFRVTRIGCGLAGYKDEDIAPMFVGCTANVKFYDDNWPYLGRVLEYCKECDDVTWHKAGCLECKALSALDSS